MTLPLDEWHESGKSELYIREVVCDIIAGTMGISDEAILGSKSGIIQMVDVGFLSDETRTKLLTEMAMRTRVVLNISGVKSGFRNIGSGLALPY